MKARHSLICSCFSAERPPRGEDSRFCMGRICPRFHILFCKFFRKVPGHQQMNDRRIQCGVRSYGLWTFMQYVCNHSVQWKAALVSFLGQSILDERPENVQLTFFSLLPCCIAGESWGRRKKHTTTSTRRFSFHCEMTCEVFSSRRIRGLSSCTTY